MPLQLLYLTSEVEVYKLNLVVQQIHQYLGHKISLLLLLVILEHRNYVVSLVLLGQYLCFDHSRDMLATLTIFHHRVQHNLDDPVMRQYHIYPLKECDTSFQSNHLAFNHLKRHL